jgi:hypothetical protein
MGRLELLCLGELVTSSSTPGGLSCCSRSSPSGSSGPGGHRFQLPFSEWGAIIPAPRLAAAIVERLTLNGHIIETGGESYRLRTTRTRRRSRSKTA